MIAGWPSEATTLTEPLDNDFAGQIVERDVAATPDAGPIRHHHFVARPHEGMSPAGTSISGREIAGAGVGATGDQDHRRLLRPASRLQNLVVGRGRLDQSA